MSGGRREHYRGNTTVRWDEERYVRVYTRDTVEWISLCWEARAVFYELTRKADRSGFVAIGKAGVRGLAKCLMLPLRVVESGLAGTEDGTGLLEDGCVVAVDGGYCIRNFVEAQEAKQSDRFRKAEQRARDRDVRLASANVRDGHAESHDVTDGHAESQPVTNRDQMSRGCPDDGEVSDNESRNVTDCPKSVRDGHTESQHVTPSLAVPSLAVPEPDATRHPTESHTKPNDAPSRPIVDAILDALRSSPKLRDVAHESMAREVAGVVGAAGIRIDDATAAIIDAAFDLPDGATEVAVRSKIRTFLKNAKKFGDARRSKESQPTPVASNALPVVRPSQAELADVATRLRTEADDRLSGKRTNRSMW